MSEEEIIGRLKRIIKIAYSKEFTTFELTYQDVDAIQGLLDLYNKQKEELEQLKNAEEYAKLGKETLLDTIHKQEKEIEKLKTDKKNASKYIREEMYVDENPTLDDDNTITELPISLNLYNEDLRKLFDLLEEK